MSIDFWVGGEPRPKQSFKFVKGGGYTPKAIKEWQNCVQSEAYRAMHGRTPFAGKVRVSMTFYLGNRRRVDCENLAKAVNDAMNNVVFLDDSQVHNLEIQKNAGCDQPGVDVHVEEL